MGGKHLKQLFPCKHCGKPFLVRPYEYNKDRIKYCGKPCYNATRPRGFGKSTRTDYDRKLASERRNPIQSAARRKLEKATRNGSLIRRPCAICNDARTEGHHWDYSGPLDVFWLCRKHHVDAHEGKILLPASHEPSVPAKGWPSGRRSRFGRSVMKGRSRRLCNGRAERKSGSTSVSRG
jgi:hypothetical protein